MNRLSKMLVRALIALIGVLVLLIAVVWLGLQIEPAPFAAIAQAQPPLETIPLPGGLPKPVERFYLEKYGENVPVIKSAVITGRGTMRLNGVLVPWRWRFTHEAGQNYRHYIEVTFFGQPFMKINEYYVGGRERMEMPWGVDENNPKLDQGGVLGMWAESIQWLPAILVTDPRVHWEPLDDETAILVTPFGQQQERFLVRFDPSNGKINYWEVMRYRNGAGDKVLWINGTWFDEGSPWAVFNAEQVTYNTDVDVSVAAKGP